MGRSGKDRSGAGGMGRLSRGLPLLLAVRRREMEESNANSRRKVSCETWLSFHVEPFVKKNCFFSPARKGKKSKPAAEEPPPSDELAVPAGSAEDVPKSPKTTTKGGSDSRPATPVRRTRPSLFEKELVRTLAEIHCVQAEAVIQLIRSEGGQLFECPRAPKDTRKRPKGYVAQKASEDEDWLTYW